MRLCLLIIYLLPLFSCDSGSFDKDKRQIIAKDVLRSHLPHHSKDFDVTGFREDTLSSWQESFFEHPIQYTLDYKYTDSTGAMQHKTGTVVFTPDGHSVITSKND